MENTVRQSLKDIGVRPSRVWLENCLNLGSNSADAVLNQLVNHDLRDVVRGDGEGPSNSSVQLRSALNQSSERMVTLPQDFRLMVQIEEVIDASRNSDDRLRDVRSANRCLKIALTDGYPPPPDHGPKPVLVAVETSPITSLSAATLAGNKLSLHGNIRCRHGVLLLSNRHATVVGGVVEHLVRAQRQALEKAKLEAGVGIDPTVRALVRDDGVALVEPGECNKFSIGIPYQGNNFLKLWFAVQRMKVNRRVVMLFESHRLFLPWLFL